MWHNALVHPMEPVVVDRGPVQEEVHAGIEIRGSRVRTWTTWWLIPFLLPSAATLMFCVADRGFSARIITGPTE